MFARLGCTCIDLLVCDDSQAAPTADRTFSLSWCLTSPERGCATPSVRAESHLCLDSVALGLMFSSALRNRLEISCIHNKDIFFINQMQLVPTFCACVQLCVALWALCLLPCSLQNQYVAVELNALHSCLSSPKFVCMYPSFIITFEFISIPGVQAYSLAKGASVNVRNKFFA